ncbi:hypothetical protein O6H91_01G046800 [Diphasiastrum complanatum]|uniref:Uncharacterized protein n=1 Tax=Diphasiastrum complanatum TaxID=34168 RepID=A0ACC2EQI3_DIPCM|nr:hypothetical protein O6H91_01G046800 [Diphasiastrum complanatum]
MAFLRPRHLAAACSSHFFPSVHLLPATVTATATVLPTPAPLVVSVKRSLVHRSFGYCDCSKQASTPSSNSCQIVAELLHPLAVMRSFRPSFFPQPFKYSSNFSDIDPIQLSELWERTLKVSRDPKKIMKAFYHSFAFVVVLAQEDASTFSQPSKKIVGVGRAVSDGAFVRQGIGRRIVKWLVQDMKNKGGPTGFAVFPPPSARRFFWMIGFRSDRKYRFMVYKGTPLKPNAEHWNEVGSIG